MSTCERIQAHLNDFLDGTLGATQAQELNAHLQDCAVCHREYRALRATQELVRTVVAVPDGQEAQRRVMTRFRQSVRAEADRRSIAVTVSSSRWRSPLVPLSATAALAALLLVVTLPQLRRSHERVPAIGGTVVIATAACNTTLPTPNDLDEMASAHAVESLTLQNGSEEPQQEALADANSRLSPDSIK